MIKKIRCTIQITINMMLGKMVRNFVILLLLIAVFVLIGTSLIALNFKYYNQIQLEKLCDIDKTGYIYFDGESENEDEYRFYDQVRQSEYVNCIGDSLITSLEEDTPNISEMQLGHQYYSLYPDPNTIERLSMDKEVLRIFDLGVDYDKSIQLPALILGYEYKDRLGDQTMIKCNGEEYPILGFTPKGSKWLCDDIRCDMLPEITGLVDTGYMCFYVREGGKRMTDASWFQLSDADDLELFKKEIDTLAKECNVPAVVCTMRDYVHLEKLRNETTYAELVDYAEKAMGVMVLFLILIKIYSFWGSKRQYGIMYSSGMTSGRITATIWVENVILFYTALAVAYVILWNSFGIIKQIYNGPYGAIEKVIQDILFERVFSQEFIVISLCCVLTSIIPTFIFNRITPLSMIRDFYE